MILTVKDINLIACFGESIYLTQLTKILHFKHTVALGNMAGTAKESSKWLDAVMITIKKKPWIQFCFTQDWRFKSFISGNVVNQQGPESQNIFSSEYLCVTQMSNMYLYSAALALTFENLYTVNNIQYFSCSVQKQMIRKFTDVKQHVHQHRFTSPSACSTKKHRNERNYKYRASEILCLQIYFLSRYTIYRLNDYIKYQLK